MVRVHQSGPVQHGPGLLEPAAVHGAKRQFQVALDDPLQAAAGLVVVGVEQAHAVVQVQGAAGHGIGEVILGDGAVGAVEQRGDGGALLRRQRRPLRGGGRGGLRRGLGRRHGLRTGVGFRRGRRCERRAPRGQQQNQHEAAAGTIQKSKLPKRVQGTDLRIAGPGTV
ncbi:MAG: hypothetical protein CMD39_00230 [Gammaproteobacteria bacterium]|nr:hypothetical protein [Gammaproteobacteria bacterium]